MLRTVIARLLGSAAILPAKIDARVQELAALVNGGLDVANLSPAVRFPVAQFAEGKALSFLSSGNVVDAPDDPRSSLEYPPHWYVGVGVVPVAGASLVALIVDIEAEWLPAGAPWAGGTYKLIRDPAAVELASVVVRPVTVSGSGHVKSPRPRWQGIAYLANPVAVPQGSMLTLQTDTSGWPGIVCVTAVVATPHAA